MVTNIKKRNLKYERNFRTYIFNGSLERHYKILKNINVLGNTVKKRN